MFKTATVLVVLLVGLSVWSFRDAADPTLATTTTTTAAVVETVPAPASAEDVDEFLLWSEVVFFGVSDSERLRVGRAVCTGDVTYSVMVDAGATSEDALDFIRLADKYLC